MPRATQKARRTPAESPGLSRERVCREALALVDEEGLDALSMRRLGARLGVEAMSLYRHVRNKADLLDSLHSAVVTDLPPLRPTDLEDWRSLLTALAHGLRKALLRHPNVVALFATRPLRTPEAVTMIERIWRELERAGFEVDDAKRAVIVVGIFTVGHALSEAHSEPAAHLGAPEGPGHAEFQFGLEAMLDGIARRASGRPSGVDRAVLVEGTSRKKRGGRSSGGGAAREE